MSRKDVDSVDVPIRSIDLVRRPRKRSEVVAHEIIGEIVAGGLSRGDALPSEAELLSRFNVSRSSLREALRLLEVQGFINIRPGPGATTQVGGVHFGYLARTLTLFLKMSGISYEKVLAAWRIADPLLAKLAARNPDRDLVRSTLEPFLKEGEDGRPVEDGPRFHDAVADLAASEVIGLLLRLLDFIVTEHLIGCSDSHNGVLDAEMIRQHRQLAQVIIDGDDERAESLMREHAIHVIEAFKATWPNMLEERVEWL